MNVQPNATQTTKSPSVVRDGGRENETHRHVYKDNNTRVDLKVTKAKEKKRTKIENRDLRAARSKIATTLLVPLRRRRLGTRIGSGAEGLRGCNERRPGEKHRNILRG